MIILYGGSFDPVHIGHMIVANEIYHAYQPDRFIFMPAKQNPLKEKSTVASEQERIKMLNIAVDVLGFGEVSSIEIDREGKSYTYDTVMELLTIDPDVLIVIGTDQYVQLEKWYKIHELYEKASFLVVNRDTDALPDDVKSIHIPRVDVSSTMLRKRLADQETVKFWLHDEVYSFIREEQIYEKEKSTETR